jgi:hypothetical protein
MVAMALVFLPSAVRADAGIPMLPVAYPVVLLYLLPVIAIEAIYLRVQLRTAWWATIKGVSIVNAITLVLGYPLAWGIALGGELTLFLVDAGAGKLGIGRIANPVLGVLGFLVPAWLNPTEDKWPILLAFAVLLLPSFALSGFAESRIICRYGLLGFEGESKGDPITLFPNSETDVPPAKPIALAIWMANVWSYLFLAAAGCLTLYLWLLRYDKRF